MAGVDDKHRPGVSGFRWSRSHFGSPGPYPALRKAHIIGLYKTEVIRQRGPWRNLEAVEFATLEWVDWFNNRRLLEPIGDVPPAELEEAYYRQIEESAMAA